jgi:UDP-N-acetylmuramoyl-L-alanyl-D-glutamate--2,6-diaminopimelate ligase
VSRAPSPVGSRSLEPASPLARIGELAVEAGAELRGDPSTPITEVAYDARSVTPGALFCCIPGETFDGHGFARAAVDGGAAGLLVERWLDDLDVPQLRVGSVRRAIGPVAAAAFGHPARAMRTVGVTGTNGKTTTTYLLEAVLGTAGLRPGVIGTTGARIDGSPVAIDRTTPEAPDLQRLLARMRDAGLGAVAMEVSSHALEHRRVGGMRFDVAVFTNLSQDHLDLHGTMEAYFAAKARLFEPEASAHGVVNVDDPWGARLAASAGIPSTTYALDAEADARADDVRVDDRGGSFRFDGVAFRTPLRGRFNVANALAAVVAARALGIDPATAASGLAEVRTVPGRMEPIDAGQGFLVMVDYAHTPDSIQHVLRGARPLTAGRVIVVFGCGGDRDRAKRSPMGEAATRSADLTIITSDNPRSEDPLAIITEIEPGARAGGGHYTIEPDRRTAIRDALRAARRGDVVVIAGKGHETGQDIGGEVVPFDDRAVAREELDALLAGAP